MQRRRDKAAAVKLMRKLLKKQGFAPEVLVTDKLRSYGVAKSARRRAGGSEAIQKSGSFRSFSSPPALTRRTSSPGWKRARTSI